MNKRTNLKETFMMLVCDSDTNLNDTLAKDIDIIYHDMTRKLCNIRIQEFLSSQKQKNASEKGLASTSGQNLRDTLLSLHTNLKSQIN